MSTTLYMPIAAQVPAQAVTRDVVKRVEDVVLGALALVVFAVVLIGIAVAIKATSPGPVFFTQPRRGKQGETFRCFKFRSMYHEHSDHHCRAQTRHNDSRVTAVGRVLRKYSLDELPQLFNVIRGDMSLVGPRPHALGTNVNGRLLHEIDVDYAMRYRVKPGITGWAQVNGSRGILLTEEQVHQRVWYDLDYITNWSLWMDIKILLRTVICVFTAKAF